MTMDMTQIQLIERCFGDFVIERFNLIVIPDRGVCTIYKHADLDNVLLILKELKYNVGKILVYSKRIEIPFN